MTSCARPALLQWTPRLTGYSDRPAFCRPRLLRSNDTGSVERFSPVNSPLSHCSKILFYRAEMSSLAERSAQTISALACPIAHLLKVTRLLSLT